MYDVVCVGGGVAGSVTASHLAKRGRRTLILERAAFPRDKACGEGILPHGVRGLERLGVSLPVATPVRGIRFRVGGASALLPFPSGHGLVVRRSHLDQALLLHAREQGVEVRQTAVRAVERGRVLTDEAVIQTRFIVGADGVHSLLHGAFGVKVRPRSSRVGFSTHVSGLVAEPDLVEVSCFSWGEVYIAPVEPEVCLVSMLVDQKMELRASQIPAFLKDVLGQRFQHAVPVAPVLGAAPVSQTVDPVVGEGWMLVGDGAGSVDPISGEGISLAILGGELAAMALDDALDGEDTMAAYAGEIHKLREPGEKLARLLLFLARRPRMARWFLRGERDLSPLMRMATGEETFSRWAILRPFLPALPGSRAAS